MKWKKGIFFVVYSPGRNGTILVDLSGKHVVAYFQGRSSIFRWSACDLDLGSMMNLSTKVLHVLIKLNTKQVAYELVFLVLRVREREAEGG
jgi:hypothetical protein